MFKLSIFPDIKLNVCIQQVRLTLFYNIIPEFKSIICSYCSMLFCKSFRNVTLSYKID